MFYLPKAYCQLSQAYLETGKPHDGLLAGEMAWNSAKNLPWNNLAKLVGKLPTVCDISV